MFFSSPHKSNLLLKRHGNGNLADTCFNIRFLDGIRHFAGAQRTQVFIQNECPNSICAGKSESILMNACFSLFHLYACHFAGDIIARAPDRARRAGEGYDHRHIAAVIPGERVDGSGISLVTIPETVPAKIGVQTGSLVSLSLVPRYSTYCTSRASKAVSPC